MSFLDEKSIVEHSLAHEGFLQVAKKDIVEVKHHYEAVTNLTKKRITLMNDEKPYMRVTQSTVPEEICDIVGWNGY